jgi:hypothetical protein
MTRRTIFAGLAAAVIVGTLVASFAVIGSPAAARDVRLDERRVNDLGQLARDIDVYWSRRGTPPPSLEALSDEGLSGRRVDPETGATYAYRLLDERRYEICAEFATQSGAPSPRPPDRFWVHAQGRQCYTVVAEAAER